MARWTAEITNDPESDYALCVELLEDAQHRGRVERAPDGTLRIVWYAPVSVPWEWLNGIVTRFARESGGAM